MKRFVLILASFLWTCPIFATPAWYKVLTIQTGQVPSSQSGFPVLVPFLSGDADFATVGNGGKATSSSGFDIRPYSNSSLTTPLSYELVPGTYSASTGAFEMWVSMTAVNGAIIYLGVGDSGLTTDGSAPATVWSSFTGVAHMADSSAISLVESKGGGLARNGAATRVAPGINGGSGAGGAASIPSNDYFTWDNVAPSNTSINLSGTTDHTISFWLKQSNPAGSEESIFASQVGVPFGGTWYYTGDTHWYWDDGDQANGRINADFTSYVGAWTYIVMTGKGDNSAGGLFFNSSSVATRSVGNTPGAMTGWGTPGNGQLSSVARIIDEYRIAPVVRSNDWITTEYNNQSAPGSFWDKSAITAVGCTPSKVVFTAQPSNAVIGASLGTVTVNVQDAGSNNCSGDTSTITITNKGGTCAGMTLAGTVSGANVFTTSNLTENAAGACTLHAADGALTAADSSAFTISAGASNKSAFLLLGLTH